MDAVAGAITVAQQFRQGVIGTPEGRTRRTIPTMPALAAALQQARRHGTYVISGAELRRDPETRSAMARICKRAGVEDCGWHVLRHTFGTHATMFGVNPWSLMTWMGHKRIDETMRYVHVATAHRRPLAPGGWRPLPRSPIPTGAYWRCWAGVASPAEEVLVA